MNYKLILALLVSFFTCILVGYFLIKIAPKSTDISNNQILSAGNVTTNTDNLPHKVMDKLTAPAFASSSNGDYVAKNRVFEVTLPKQIQGQVKIIKSKSLEFSPISAKNSEAKTIGNKVVYENAFDSNDISYETTEKGIKESIIIKSQEKALNEYKYSFNARDLNARLNDDNSITFTQISKEASRDIPVSDGTIINAKKASNFLPEHPEIFKIPSPIMIDANGDKSKNTDVKVILSKDTLTLIPNKEWLQKAKFPVILDPTIEVSPQIVEELAEERTSTAKEFLNDDGSFTSVIFQNPIHYQDILGKFKDIDRTFEESNDPNYPYQVNTGIYVAKLKKTLSGSNDINLDFSGSNLGLSPVKIGWSNGQNLGTLKNVNGQISSDKSKVIYKSIYGISGIDLEAIYDNEKFLKETVINSKDAIQAQNHSRDNLEITFNIDIPQNIDLEVNGKLWDKNSSVETNEAITVMKNGQPISDLRKAIAYNPESNKIEVIKVKLSKNVDKLTLTKIIPGSWLNSVSYPIRTDTTDTIYGITGDGTIDSYGDPYSQARDGNGLLADTTGTLAVGQKDDGCCGVDVWETFIGFDTSVVGSDTVSSATLSMYLTNDFSTNAEFINQARVKSWSGGGLTIADWVAGGSLSTLTLVSTLDTTSIGATGDYKTFTSDAAFVSNINGSGNTELIIVSSRTTNNNAPGTNTDEYVYWQNADFAGTSQDPKLVVVHSAPVAGGANIGPGVNIGPGTNITTN